MKENYVGAIDSKNPCVFYLKSLKYICTQCDQTLNNLIKLLRINED